jgi:hypothetical protein
MASTLTTHQNCGITLRSKQPGTVFQQAAVLKINTFNFQCGSNIHLLTEFIIVKECYCWDEGIFKTQVGKKTVCMCKEQLNITVMSVGTITMRLPTYECLLCHYYCNLHSFLTVVQKFVSSFSDHTLSIPVYNITA